MKKHIKKFMALTLTAAILAGSGGIYAATRSTTTQSTDSSATTDTALTANTSTMNTAAQATDSSSTNTTPRKNQTVTAAQQPALLHQKNPMVKTVPQMEETCRDKAAQLRFPTPQ